MTRKVLIIEDNVDELNDLRSIISGHADFEYLGGASTTNMGRQLIYELKPEGIFLDISFQTEGKKKGLELAIELNALPANQRPWIIFITGNPQGHAAEITEKNIHHDGFVKKPFCDLDVAARLLWIRNQYPKNCISRRVEVKHRISYHGKNSWVTRFLMPEEIIFVEKNAHENTTRMHIIDDCIELDGIQRNIGDLEKELKNHSIVRIQNSYLVNLQHVAGYDRDYVYLKCKCGKHLPLGRSFEENFCKEYATLP